MLDDIVRHPEKSGRSVANFVTVALEDRISALTTKDPNKLKVYLEGYDGHCLRTASYSAEQMPEVTAARDEIAKPGQTYKVTYSDGTVEFFNENNPLLKELRNASSTN